MDTLILDHAIEILQDNKERWVRLPATRKAELIGKLVQGVLSVADRQVAKALEAKGIAPDSTESAEEWLSGPFIVLRNLRLLKQSLDQIARYGIPKIPANKIHIRHNGQVVVRVFPDSIFDKLLYPGFNAEVWMKPEVTLETLHEKIASYYRRSQTQGGVALVLGAGNVPSIGPLDVVYKLFVEGQVCLLKLNPVNDYLGMFIEESFASLIQEGYLRLAYGGADVGSYLCEHTGIDEIHITGSAQTHDSIVFGSGEEGADRKRNNMPRLKKQITSELGNVSPVIIVPGEWSEGDLRSQAENVASQLTNNAGFNCNAAKVLITHTTWNKRDAFLDTLRKTLSQIPQRRAYYPGSLSRYARFIEAHPEAEIFGKKSETSIPWTLIPNLDPERKSDICFKEEAFCGIIGETPIAASDAADFLFKAVAFCNNTLWGTLNACIIIHPETETELGSLLDHAVSDLRYGSIGINHWPALSYALGSTTWGAYPGHTLDDIQSGIGVVHNTLMFDEPQKSVIYGPFRVWPKPPWFVTHKSAHKLAPILTRFEASPRFSLLPSMWLALRG
ncbi:MAG: aldehyde dehydrogenase family protein [Candidatus Dadabacteria bacterium]|nr:aldehyde dehydrogenase family protein [Candidatus Dadabacteria bacterium]